MTLHARVVSTFLGGAAVCLLAVLPAAAQDVEITPGATMVSASTNDGNVPANAVDNNLATRWSANGDGQWLTLDLGSAQTISYAKIAWYVGNTRRAKFDLLTSNDNATWTPLLAGAQSSGTSAAEETVDFPDVSARYVRYLGHGNTDTTKPGWNSLTEISLFRTVIVPTPTPTAVPPTPTPTPTPTATAVPTATPTPTPITGAEVEITAIVSASTDDGNVPANAVDGNLATRWSANGDGQWLMFDLGTTRTITRVTVAAFNGTTRRNRFDLQVAAAAAGPWTNLLTGAMTSGTSAAEESFDVPDTSARFLRYLGHGNTAATNGTWNSITEASVFGLECTACATPTPTATPVVPTATPTASPTPGGGTFPARTFAPYIETWNNRSLRDIANATGHKFYTLAFIINGGSGCNPTWNGGTALGNYYAGHIADLRAMGGDVIVSFGGASGDEIGIRCTTVATLQAAYQRVVDAYKLKWLDLDIEGNEMGDTASIDRRNKAIAGLQAANPGLRISYTLAVDRTGLPSREMNLLRNAMTNGARVDVVNIMAMDYGPCYTDMGQAGVDAARATRTQLAGIGMNATVGITPMINTNDVACEKFSTTDAQVVTSFAQANPFVSHLAFWSLDADIAAGYPHTRIFHTFH
jgi:chitinase